VLLDRARLTVRAEELGLDAEQAALAMGRPPLRVLVDGSLRVPLDAPFYAAGPAIVASRAEQAPALQAAGHSLLTLPGADGFVDLRQLLLQLAGQGANEVLVEAGPRLAGAFARLGLVDEYR